MSQLPPSKENMPKETPYSSTAQGAQKNLATNPAKNAAESSSFVKNTTVPKPTMAVGEKTKTSPWKLEPGSQKSPVKPGQNAGESRQAAESTRSDGRRSMIGMTKDKYDAIAAKAKKGY